MALVLMPSRRYGRKVTEQEGFEPPIPKGYNGFQDRRFQPLSHCSIILIYYTRLFNFATFVFPLNVSLLLSPVIGW